MSGPSVEAARETRLRNAFATEERAALKLLMIVRSAVSAAVITFLLSRFPNAGGLYWAGLTLVFAMIGVVQYLLGRSRHHGFWHKYVIVALDLALVSFIILYPNPFLAEPFPPALQLRYPNFDYLYLVVALMALSYSPGAALWAGVAAVLAWGAGVLWVISLPGTLTHADFPNYDALPLARRLAIDGDPNVVDMTARIQEFFVMIVFAGVLATAAWRARRVVGRQMQAERAHANLARYFSPGLIDELAESDEPLGAVREQNVAVLFADIVGFTKLSEAAPPEEVIALLRDFHGRMAGEVFAHDGTVDKYIGDAIMATFGTPRAGPRDATNALRCADAMLASVNDWNRARATRSEPPVRVGIGLHFGAAVMGDIGDERRLEYAVVGDTVNVASRLEALTRKVGALLIVSDDAVAAARREGADGAVIGGLRRGGTSAVRGRKEGISFWRLDAPAPADP